MTNAEKIKAIDAEIKFQEAELKRLREELKAITTQEENQVDRLFDAVLNCPHSITHESVTLHFYPRQKEGHNALAQLHHRLAAYDQEARQRELQLLSEIEALERLALANLKQQEAEATPIAWYVTGCSTMLDEHDAKAEAKRCGGSAKAVPLYTAPPVHADALGALNSLTRYTVGRLGNGPMHTFAHPEGPYLRYTEVEAAMAAQARNKKGIEQ